MEFETFKNPTQDVKDAVLKSADYSMTSGRRLAHTYVTVQELDANNIEGDIVECGVWKGGQIISAYLANTQTKRKFWLFDTFEGMTQPTEHDFRLQADGVTRGYAKDSGKAKRGFDQWCRSEIQEVQQNLSKFNMPMEQTTFVKGDIVQTLNNPSNVPNKIALLRLDTDWYESTLKELKVLWPKLVIGGYMVLDDYGSWQGSKKAFHEVFGDSLEIHNIDGKAVYIKKDKE
jgi:hypothetical protein